MKHLITHLLTSLLLIVSANLNAADNPNQTDIKNWEIHHIAFPSTFIQADVAKAVGVKRRNDNGLINISVLEKTASQKTPVKLQVTGYAQNLVGQRKTLSFKQVDETNAVYYIAEIGYSNQETFRFFITLTEPTSGRIENIQFSQKMWVD